MARSGFANYLNARSDTGAAGGPRVPMRGDTLKSGAFLSLGESISSKNGRAKFALQTDGNLVAYGDGAPLWAAGSGPGRGTYRAWMQTDGNFVIYIRGNRSIWDSGTAGNPGAYLKVQDDGNVVVYGPGGNALWSTETNGFRKYESSKGLLGDVVSGIASAVTAPISGLAHAAVAVATGHNVLESLKAGAAEMFAPGVSVLKKASPVLNVAAGLASFVPGIGTLAASGLQVAAALGRGASVGDLALAAARGAIPGGAIAKVAFDAAVGIATHQPITGIALGEIRNQIPGGDIGKAAFDAGLAVAYHATPEEAAHAANAIGNPAAKQGFAHAVLAAHTVRKAPPAVHAAIHRQARAKTRAKSLSNRARTWVTRAITVHARTRLDTRGLDQGGKTYTVEKGDSAWRIAQNLTADGNHHWKELVAANHPPKTLQADGNFRYLNTGEKLQIPQSWIGKFVAVSNVNLPVGGDPLSLPSPLDVPQVQPPPLLPSTPSATLPIPPAPPAPTPPVVDPGKNTTVSGERDDPAAIAQAKSVMVAWEHTDGTAAAGLPDYGGNPDDQNPIWGPRDSLELRAFVVWSNAHGTALSLLGDLTQEKLDALAAWAENKAKSVATGQGTVSPTGVEPAPTGGTATTAQGGSPTMTAASMTLPETDISSDGGAAKKSGSGFGFGIAALVLLGVGAVAISASEGKKRAAA